MDDFVDVYVGSDRFVTTRRTLCNCQGYLQGMVIEMAPQQTSFRIDRDPTHFRHVLNHLRGSTTYPSDAADLDALRHEADFYALDELVRAIDFRKQQLARDSIAHYLQLIASTLHARFV